MKRNEHNTFNAVRSLPVRQTTLGRWFCTVLTAGALLGGGLSGWADDPVDASPRDLFNLGTQQLKAGKLNDAETSLQSAVGSQDVRIQPAALYNLGFVRVSQGAEILKQNKAKHDEAAQAHEEALASAADAAGREIDDAIASHNLQDMIMAYLRGGGVQHEISSATKAVQSAMNDKKDVLAKWQRADGDFRSAAELNSQDPDAPANAASTEKAIAALIDEMNRTQQGAMKMKAAAGRLGEKLKGLKGMIPKPNMPPGAPGDDDQDEDSTGLKKGEKEGASKPGDEMKISPQEAEQILNGFKLGGDHGLPLGNKGNGKPQGFSGKNW